MSLFQAEVSREVIESILISKVPQKLSGHNYPNRDFQNIVSAGQEKRKSQEGGIKFFNDCKSI